MKFQKLLSLGLATMLAACGGGGGGGGGGSTTSDPVYNGWYDVYHNKCGNLGPGCNYYANGLKIVDSQDPYYRTNYVLQNRVWTYNGQNLCSGGGSCWAWQSPDNIIYNSYGNALNHIKTAGRNMVGDAASAELKKIAEVAQDHAARYGLSMEAATQQVRLLNNWAVLGRDQARTEADLADIAERLYGQDINKIKVALNRAKDGDRSMLKQMARDCANKWGTTPEQVVEMQKNWYAPYLQGYNMEL